MIVATGSSAPNLLGKFNDKTSIEADRTPSSCRGNVYFAWSRFTGNGGVAIYLTQAPTVATVAERVGQHPWAADVPADDHRQMRYGARRPRDRRPSNAPIRDRT